MASLDLKIPPPAVALVCAGLAWLIARFTPGLTYALAGRLAIATLLVLAGFSLDLAGLVVFRRARTTLSPSSPERSTSIVRSGLYRFTRNPMYLGLTLVLLGVCVYFANPLTLFAIVAFVAYLTRFQIMPEERALLAKFGETYAQYTRSVRRWL